MSSLTADPHMQVQQPNLFHPPYLQASPPHQYPVLVKNAHQGAPPYHSTQPPSYAGPHNVVRKGPPSPQCPRTPQLPQPQYARPPQSPPRYPHQQSHPTPQRHPLQPHPPIVHVQPVQNAPVPKSPPAQVKPARSHRPAKKADSEPQIQRTTSGQTLRVPRHSAETSSSEEASGTSGRSSDDGRSRLKRSTSADHAEWLSTLKSKTVSSIIRHKGGKPATLPCQPEATPGLSEAFEEGPHLLLSDAGRTVQGRSAQPHRWPATALGTLLISADSTKRHRWTVTHLSKGVVVPPLVGIAPESVDVTKPNNQRLSGGGWYLSLGNCTLYSGGSGSSSPRLKGATTGLPDLAVPEGESVIVELDPSNHLLSFTAHGEKVTAYRSIDCSKAFRLAVLLSLGSQVGVTEYSEEDSQPI